MDTSPFGDDTNPPAQRMVEPAPDALTIEELREIERHAKIAQYAYYLALARGFAPGNELDDWLAGERAVNEERVGSGM